MDQPLPTLFHGGKERAVPPSPAQPRAGDLFPPRPGWSFLKKEQATRTRTCTHTHYTHIQALITCPSCSFRLAAHCPRPEPLWSDRCTA